MTTRVPGAVRLLPSLKDVVFLAPVVFLCARTEGAKTLLGDGDTGWHIRTGEWILSNGKVPLTDMFSFTKPGQAWFAWEWLWDVAFALLHHWGGMAAVLLASMAVIAITFAMVYSMARKMSGNAVVSAVVTLLAVVASSIHWLARPHLFTLLLMVVFYRVVEARSRRALLLGLPLLMVLWTNLHGGFIAGLLLLGIYVAGEGAQALFSRDPERRTRSRAGAFLFAQSLGLCALATLLNPYGYQLHVHVFAYLTDGYQLANIAEFQSLSFHHPLSRVVEILFLLGLGTALFNLVRGRFTPFFLLLFWAHLALVSTRNIPIFVIVATPLIAVALQDCIFYLTGVDSPLRWPAVAGRVSEFCAGISEMEAIPRWHAASWVGLAVFGAMLLSPAPAPRFASNYDAHEYPERALQTLEGAGSLGRVFSTEVWGGYMIYRLYPQVKVFVDGRSDFYGPAFGDAYTSVLNGKPGWEASLRKHGIETVLLPTDSFLSNAMKESKNWRCIYDDGIAIVFRPVEQIPAKDKQVSTAVVHAGRDRKVAATERTSSSGNRPQRVMHS